MRAGHHTDESTLINLNQYPIHLRHSDSYLRLVADTRARFEEEGCCKLTDFITPSGLRVLQAECRTFAQRRSDQRGRRVNCYYTASNEWEAPDHPSNILFEREFGVIRDDMLPQSAALRRIYDSQDLLRFVADVVGLPEFFQSRDAYQALTVNCMRDQEQLHWHFDCNDFAITLGIQEPIEGGELEFVRDIGRDNINDVQQVLSQDVAALPPRLKPRRIETTEGALIFFRGGESIHRVLPTRGHRERLVAALQYHQTHDAFDDPATTERIYGIDPQNHIGPKRTI
ncbi:MAG: hypothetical protein ACI9GW_002058, partial [Halieaceae bacterium]